MQEIIGTSNPLPSEHSSGTTLLASPSSTGSSVITIESFTPQPVSQVRLKLRQERKKKHVKFTNDVQDNEFKPMKTSKSRYHVWWIQQYVKNVVFSIEKRNLVKVTRKVTAVMTRTMKDSAPVPTMPHHHHHPLLTQPPNNKLVH